MRYRQLGQSSVEVSEIDALAILITLICHTIGGRMRPFGNSICANSAVMGQLRTSEVKRIGLQPTWSVVQNPWLTKINVEARRFTCSPRLGALCYTHPRIIFSTYGIRFRERRSGGASS